MDTRLYGQKYKIMTSSKRVRTHHHIHVGFYLDPGTENTPKLRPDARHKGQGEPEKIWPSIKEGPSD